MTTEELYSWLCSFINMEQGLGGNPSSSAEEHFKLDRIRALAGLAGHPEFSAPVIHVAGSKGKGSVVAMTASVLENAGIKTARYMSPHVSDWRERISRGDGSFFTDAAYVKAGEELRKIYESYRELKNNSGINQKTGADSAAYSGEPTFFELMTLLFFLCARLEQCKAMVVETGLGGRLDATNIVSPAVSVITVIEKEHTEYLGNTLVKIAGEKAGIIKKNRPVVSAEQAPEVLAVLRQKAEEQNAPFVLVTESVDIPGMKLAGKIYNYNAALTIEALRLTFPGISKTSVEKGLASVTLPARFEKLPSEPPFIVDGAHTPLSVKQCAKTFCELYGDGGILLFGCAAGKDAGSMAEILLPRFSRCIITATGSFRASEPAAVYETFCRISEHFDSTAERQNGTETSFAKPEIIYIPDTQAAIEEAIKSGKEKNLPILGCGSFYLAAEIRKQDCVSGSANETAEARSARKLPDAAETSHDSVGVPDLADL